MCNSVKKFCEPRCCMMRFRDPHYVIWGPGRPVYATVQHHFSKGKAELEADPDKKQSEDRSTDFMLEAEAQSVDPWKRKRGKIVRFRVTALEISLFSTGHHFKKGSVRKEFDSKLQICQYLSSFLDHWFRYNLQREFPSCCERLCVGKK
jgi:hypothetical protein